MITLEQYRIKSKVCGELMVSDLGHPDRVRPYQSSDNLLSSGVALPPVVDRVWWEGAQYPDGNTIELIRAGAISPEALRLDRLLDGIGFVSLMEFDESLYIQKRRQIRLGRKTINLGWKNLSTVGLPGE